MTREGKWKRRQGGLTMEVRAKKRGMEEELLLPSSGSKRGNMR